MKRIFTALICTVLISCLFAACGGASYAPTASSSASYAAPAAPQMEYYSEDSAYYDDGGEGGYKYGGGDSESAIELPLLTPSAANGKKMIYTVGLSLQTTDFHGGMRKLLDTVTQMGGYVESANVRGRDMRYPETERSAAYTFRVPSERLSEFLVIVEDNYNLLGLNQESQNRTAKYEQADTRLEDLTAQEKRLLEDLEKTTETSEKLALERRLAEVQASISGLKASQVSVDDAVLYSTVTVQLYEVIFEDELQDEPELLFGEKLTKTVKSSANGFIAFCQGLLLVIITLAPAVLILSIFAVVALPIVRFVKKRKLIKSAIAENEKEASGTKDNE